MIERVEGWRLRKINGGVQKGPGGDNGVSVIDARVLVGLPLILYFIC